MTQVISLLATGGTISTGRSDAGAVPRYEASDQAGWMAVGDVQLRSRDVVRISSRAVTPETMFVLATAVREEIAAGVDGVVITHGTDTLEETAYALALLVDTPVPVVLTGAMRSPDHLGSDAAANLAAAVAVAGHQPMAAYGPVVVLQDEVHVARLVTKYHSARIAAVASPQGGPVAAVVEGRVEVLLGPAPRSERLPVTARATHRVELLWAVAGADGMIVDAIADRVDGLVVAGTGGGHVAPPLAEALVRLARSGRPVVLASRCSAPQVLQHTYGGPGSETQLLADGLISAGSLQPAKARLRLLFALAAGLEAEEVFRHEVNG